MKKTAAIFFLFFAFLQATPAISGFFSKSCLVTIADEEKGSGNSQVGKMRNKDYSLIFFLYEEKIYPAPCLEKPTPPPNYC